MKIFWERMSGTEMMKAKRGAIACILGECCMCVEGFKEVF